MMKGGDGSKVKDTHARDRMKYRMTTKLRRKFVKKLGNRIPLDIRKKQMKIITSEFKDKLLKEGCNFISHAQLVEMTKKPSIKTCHIIGSGWSARSGLDCIKESDCVLGANFAGFLLIKFDMYFVELASKKTEYMFHRTQQQSQLVEEIRNSHNTEIFFKNIWAGPNDISSMSKIYGNKAWFVENYKYPFFNENEFIKSLASLLEFDNQYMVSICSSIVEMIILAYWAGYRNIVIHGVDFGGKHFFKLEDFQNPRVTTPPRMYYEVGADTNENHHPTASNSYGLQRILPILERMLSEKGVALYAATAVTPLSRFLPIFGLSDSEAISHNGINRQV